MRTGRGEGKVNVSEKERQRWFEVVLARPMSVSVRLWCDTGKYLTNEHSQFAKLTHQTRPLRCQPMIVATIVIRRRQSLIKTVAISVTIVWTVCLRAVLHTYVESAGQAGRVSKNTNHGHTQVSNCTLVRQHSSIQCHNK